MRCLGWLLLAVAAGIVAALLTVAVQAHEAPEGWSYDPECCSGMDCQPVEDNAVQEVQGGFWIDLPPGGHRFVPADSDGLRAFLPFSDPRIRASKDERIHVCVSPDKRLLCVYLMPRGV